MTSFLRFSMGLLALLVPAPGGKNSDPALARSASAAAGPAESHKLQEAKQAILRLPLAFEKNQGQAAPAAQFTSRLGDIQVSFLPDRALFALPAQPPRRTASAPLSLRFAGANLSTRLAAIDPLPGKANYLIGSDARRWRTNTSQYQRVRYSNLYPGIDLLYYGNQERLEHDFLVAAHADPAQVVIEVGGAKQIHINSNGDAELHTTEGSISLQHPAVYQETAGVRRTISGAYVLRSGNRLSFKLGEYDHSRPLVIDPVILFSLSLGGNSFTQANGIAMGATGNIFVTGFTQATNFPVHNPAQGACSAGCGNSDAFLTELDPTGSTVLYSTYFGGSGIDQGLAVAVDSNGAAYITGTTASGNFPVKNPFQATTTNSGSGTAFVAKFDSTGALVYSTYLGGSNYEDFNGGYDAAIAVDSTGAAYVTGSTASTDFPTKNPLQAALAGGTDVYLTKLAPSGSTLSYSTYLGTTGSEGAAGIAVDSSGNAYNCFSGSYIF